MRHYYSNDLEVAKRLVKFQMRHGRDKEAEGYIELLEELRKYRSLASIRGMHTYIAVGPKKRLLPITVYIILEIYTRARNDVDMREDIFSRKLLAVCCKIYTYVVSGNHCLFLDQYFTQ